MHAVIRSVGLLNGEPLESFLPTDPANCSETVRVMIGGTDIAGEESFDVLVCTLQSLESELEMRGYIFTLRRLIVGSWNPELIIRAIEARLSNLSGESWSELAGQICRFAAWKFEDYQSAIKA